MKRNISLDEISDGKLYKANDIAKTDCNGCQGCSSCCRGMGSSIILDPLDVHRLKQHLSKNFQKLLMESIELNLVDGSILPNLKMKDEGCSYLDDHGRCKVHSARPGICRIFPLGRVYEGDEFYYILQIHECPAEKSEIRIRKWIDTPELKRYEQYILEWHRFLKEIESIVEKVKDEEICKKINLYVINQFYQKDFRDECDFYLEVQKRLAMVRENVYLLIRDYDN